MTLDVREGVLRSARSLWLGHDHPSAHHCGLESQIAGCSVRFHDGDLLVLQGRVERLNDKLAALGWLPLAERNVPLGRTRNLYLPAVVCHQSKV